MIVSACQKTRLSLEGKGDYDSLRKQQKQMTMMVFACQENTTRFQIEKKKTQSNCGMQSAFPTPIIEISGTFELSITPHSILYHASNIRHLIYLSERSSNTRYASYSTFKSQHKGINSSLRILALHSLHQTPGMHLIHCITITSQANNETEKFEDNLCLVNDSKQRDNEAASCLSSGSFTPFCSSLPFHALLQFLSFDAPSSTSLLI